MKYIIVTKKIWNKKNFTKKFKSQFYITNKINLRLFTKINPKIIFFIHWSKIVKEDIFSKYHCIQFHASHLPYGRGGSPIQNLVLRGIKKTKISAFVIKNKKIDAGPIILQKKFILTGSANIIYQRMEKISLKMIYEIVKRFPILEKIQTGKLYYFKRRKPHESNITNNNFKKISEVYDFIRMFDAKGYPLCFLKVKNLNIKFKNAKINKKKVKADVEINFIK